MKAVIAGAGIGGLGAAIALSLRGWSVEVLEQARALSEIGAGLQISPNGWRVLQALGVADRLTPTQFEPEAIEMRMGRSGLRVFHLPLRTHARQRWGAPYIHIHRADLLAALQARLGELAPEAVRTDAAVVRYTQDEGHVTFHLKYGAQASGTIGIGADGLHSVIRAQMLGPDQPRYTGNVAWRTVVPVELLGDHVPPPTACIWPGDKCHAITTRLRGGTLANFVGMVEQPDPGPEGWRVEGNKADLAQAYAGWNPVITSIIAQAEKVNRWALFDRPPLARWHEGRVALLGDAAHPMMPSMAQGAVQALEDGWVLASVLSAETPPETAYKRYFALRQPRTARIQAGSAANARLFHHAAPLRKLAVYGPMAIAARVAPGVIHRRQDWVYSYDATSVAG